MQGYQIYTTASISACYLVSLRTIASTESTQPVVGRKVPAVPASPGHAMYSHLYPPSRCRRR